MRELPKFFSVFLPVILFILVGCNSSTEPPSPNIIWNLQIDNNWTFIDSLYVEDSIFVDTVFVEITKQIQFEQQNEIITASCLQESIYSEINKSDSTTSHLFKNEDDGLFSYGKLIESADTTYLEIAKNLQFKFPVEIGDIWLFDTDNMECVDTSENIITPYGNFSCYVYKLTGQNEITYYYCVPYIGIVGKIIEAENGVILYKRLLTYYNIG